MSFAGIGGAHSLDSSTAHADAVPAGSLKFHYNGVNELGGGDTKIGAFGILTVVRADTVDSELLHSMSAIICVCTLCDRAGQEVAGGPTLE